VDRAVTSAMALSTTDITVVVPTVGRPSLLALLYSIVDGDGPVPARLVIVDDRPDPADELPVPTELADRVSLLHSGGCGPAAARNVGWRAAGTPWVVFADDDVLLPCDWSTRLIADLDALPPQVAGSQARIRVPLPDRPTDWARNTAGLAHARWATAEMAYRREVLLRLDGFDERFRRAYREDADLALRALAAGYELTRGNREVIHPVRKADRWASVRAQAGNADDALMSRKHGPPWRVVAQAPAGRLRWHLLTVAAAAAAAGGLAAGRPRHAAVAAAVWVGLTGRFAWLRIAPGPRTAGEVGTMLATSVAIPPVAAFHRARGALAHRSVRRWTVPPRVVLFDRDGTLIEDVPYNGEPELVRPVPGAREALDRLRARGIRLGVVTNQSGIGRGLVSASDVAAVNQRVADLLGPFDAWAVCPHAPDDGCGCRKPAPGLIEQALSVLGEPAWHCAVVGDIGSDVVAAQAAGALPVLVPTPVTLAAEVAAAPRVAPTLSAAVDLLLAEPTTVPTTPGPTTGPTTEPATELGRR
jgi:histidinol-phosphate phosphatase family protein